MGNALSGLFPPNECGANSPHPVVQTFHLLNEHDMTALLAPQPLRTGSSDKLLAAHALFGDDMTYSIACQRGSVWAILFPRKWDEAHLISDMGPLPSTWETTCAGKGITKWFKAPSDGVQLQVGTTIHGTSAKLLKSVSCPFSPRRIDRHTLADASEPRYEWVKGHEPWACNLAELPLRWIAGLPHVGALKLTATVERRAEWCASPSSPRYSGR